MHEGQQVVFVDYDHLCVACQKKIDDMQTAAHKAGFHIGV